MNLERVSNEEKLNLCRKYYLGNPRVAGEEREPNWSSSGERVLRAWILGSRG